MAKRIIIALFILVLAGAAPSLAAAIQGELNSALTYEWDESAKKVEYGGARSGFRLVLEDYTDSGGKLHLSARGWRDWQSKEGAIRGDQLWFRGYFGDVDYTVGKQPLSWGTADGFNPTNYFSRLSSDALLSGELGGEPLWAGQASYYGSGWSATGVLIPVFTPQELDAEMRRQIAAGGAQGAMLLRAIETAEKPEGFGKGVELALRLETQLAGFDLQGSYFTGFEPLPGLETLLTIHPILGLPTKIEIQGRHRRQHFVGLATAGTLGDAGLWAELSYGGPQSFEQSSDPLLIRKPLSINKKYWQVVLGGDYTLGRGLLTQVQYIYRGQGSLLAPYVEPDQKIEGAHYLYGRFSCSPGRDSTVDLLVLHGFQEKGGLVSATYTHRFSGSLQGELGLIWPYGTGDFTSIPKQARLGVTYQF